ncbi:sensor histidine kinase [Pontibacter rugosus]|uniref:Oxygen sensor histidine kinase NreB n=1 Tax=Pontibacter rugosus TaxID=1745966 RepID=A0ABW3SYB7_9BACT
MSTLEPVILITPVLLVLSVGIIVFVVLYQRRMLQHQEHLRELQDVKQQQLLEVTLQTQEDERRRVARDLHDEVGAMLALIKLNLYQLVNNVEVKDEGLLTAGYNIKQQLDDVLSSVRRISHDLMPVVLEKMGLVQSLEALRRTLASGSNQLEMIVKYNEKNRRLNPKNELLLYRMVQELLNNTLKHAEATQVTVELLFESENILLVYTDNGKGFNLHTLQEGENLQGGGLGIMSLQSRAALMGGHITLTSSPGAGIRAEINVPVMHAKKLAHTTN